MSDGAFIRASTLGTPGPRAQRGRPNIEVQAVVRTLVALNRIGSNVNQTTRALNEFLLIARETGADRLASVITDAIEQNRAIADDLVMTLDACRRALGSK